MLDPPGAAAFTSTNTVLENKAQAFNESGAPGAPCSAPPMEEPTLEAQPGRVRNPGTVVRAFPRFFQPDPPLVSEQLVRIGAHQVRHKRACGAETPWEVSSLPTARMVFRLSGC